MRRILTILSLLIAVVLVAGCGDEPCHPHRAYWSKAYTEPAYTDMEYVYWYSSITESCTYIYKSGEECEPVTTPIYHWIYVYHPAEYHPAEYHPRVVCAGSKKGL